jgi:hypothetical protein
VITNKPDPTAFDALRRGEVSSIDGGGTGYDLNGMVNIPLVQDRLALRLVGFTSEDAGYIDNILSVSPGVQAGLVGTRPTPFDNASQVDEDVNSTTTSGGRAALRWDVTDDVDLTLGALLQDGQQRRTANITACVGDFNQVGSRRKVSTTSGTSSALRPECAAAVRWTWRCSASYFDRDFRYEPTRPIDESASTGRCLSQRAGRGHSCDDTWCRDLREVDLLPELRSSRATRTGTQPT